MDRRRLQGLVEAYYDEQPHPNAPSLRVKDYEAYARVAMMLNDKLPEPHETEAAYHALQGAGLSPAEFEYGWGIARPLANRLLDRDPHLLELQRLKDARPSDWHAYYFHHPHPQAPEVAAGEMARYRQLAMPYSHDRYQRDPNVQEVSRFALGQYDQEAIAQHYQPSEG